MYNNNIIYVLLHSFLDTIFVSNCFLFNPTELQVVFYDVSFTILSEVYRPELADDQSEEFLKLSKEVRKLVCTQNWGEGIERREIKPFLA